MCSACLLGNRAHPISVIRSYTARPSSRALRIVDSPDAGRLSVVLSTRSNERGCVPVLRATHSRGARAGTPRASPAVRRQGRDGARARIGARGIGVQRRCCSGHAGGRGGRGGRRLLDPRRRGGHVGRHGRFDGLRRARRGRPGPDLQVVHLSRNDSARNPSSRSFCCRLWRTIPIASAVWETLPPHRSSAADKNARSQASTA